MMTSTRNARLIDNATEIFDVDRAPDCLAQMPPARRYFPLTAYI